MARRMSGPGNVIRGTGGGGGNVHSRKSLAGKCLVGKVSVGELSFGEVSV